MSKSIAEIFIEEAMKTNTGDYSTVIERISNPKTIKLAHAIIGMATEAGELLDALKKHIIYGKPLDEVNLVEECGDSNWYQALLLHTIGKTFEECMVANIQKLRKRYSDRFTEDEALNRNLKEERNELEKTIDYSIGFGMGVNKLVEALNAERMLVDSLPKEETNTIYPEKEAGSILHELTENVVDRVKMEIVDDNVEPTEHLTHKSTSWVRTKDEQGRDDALMATLCGLETEVINTASNWEYVDCQDCLSMKN